MLSFAGALKVFLAMTPQDLRKSFNGLSALVCDHLQADPYQGALYVFTNRSHTRLKILFWDGTGLWVACKRLEQGRFSWPKPSHQGQKSLSLTPEALALLTDGIDLKGARMRPWYEREEEQVPLSVLPFADSNDWKLGRRWFPIIGKYVKAPWQEREEK